MRGGWLRLRGSALPILQCALAAGLAWFVAHDLLGHQRPFFAPTAAVISIGVSLGARLRRSVELVVGVAVGIGIGEVFISWVGTGPAQIALVVGAAMAIAVFLDRGAIIPMQAASSAVLVATLLTPSVGGSGLRMIDALVGGLVGIAVVAVLPQNPLRRSREQAADILAVVSRALTDCADGLHEQDADLVKSALTAARATQSQLDSLRSALAGGREVSQISPVYWHSRSQLETIRAAAEPLDNAVRNVRVLLRRALSLVRDDEILNPGIVAEIEQLAAAVDVVRRFIVAEPGEQPDAAAATRELRRVAKGARKELVEGGGLSAHVVLAQIRSVLVDLMQVCGMKRLSALAMLPPTVPHPYVQPAD
ncbi:aromatic acid exporter family protein [Nocardia stercoris]|uniref:Aromatic acid exporter family protein n=1 Tax=Nocardia stercoris TaxID=2483361 RepID=A0A3M2KY40_9NOCA|nr:FUSC family protein [Nocardia stercoris]RMI29380.1 aromatic acid exporter family protein [Nocardia stercoris]